jgi:3-methylfumaryl-CoA hydratase
MTEWAGWIGREERVTDLVAPAHARRWCATFDRAAPDAGPLPQGIHWCLCPPEAPSASLGPDGHPLRTSASLLPPVPLPRRMWAGSDIAFLTPIAVGQAIERVSRIISVEEKYGRSGALAFVTLEHAYSADSAVAVKESQTLVFREAPPPGTPPVPPLPSDATFEPSGWDRIERRVPDAPLLFRYSALTFNTHRIHYDADYVRDAEGYRGLVVHGPLMASLLLQLAAREVGENALKRFAFRAVGPAIAGEELVLALARRDTLALGVFAGDGREVMRAEAE